MTGHDDPESCERGALTLLSGNLMAGGIGRCRTEQRFPALMAVAARLHLYVFAARNACTGTNAASAWSGEAEGHLGMSGVLGISPQTRMHTALFVRVLDRRTTDGDCAVELMHTWIAEIQSAELTCLTRNPIGTCARGLCRFGVRNGRAAMVAR